jgi:hypothetical protein
LLIVALEFVELLRERERRVVQREALLALRGRNPLVDRQELRLVERNRVPEQPHLLVHVGRDLRDHRVSERVRRFLCLGLRRCLNLDRDERRGRLQLSGGDDRARGDVAAQLRAAHAGGLRGGFEGALRVDRLVDGLRIGGEALDLAAAAGGERLPEV